MSNERIEPCPFCESQLEMLINKPWLVYRHPENECLLSNRVVTETEIEKWNTRKPMERIVERLEEQFKYNAEQAEIWISGENVDAYMIEKSNDYIDRANCYGKAIRIVKGGGADEVD